MNKTKLRLLRKYSVTPFLNTRNNKIAEKIGFFLIQSKRRDCTDIVLGIDYIRGFLLWLYIYVQ